MKRDRNDAMLFGVCAGLAKELNIDVRILRATFAIFAILGFGFPFVVYCVLAILMN